MPYTAIPTSGGTLSALSGLTSTQIVYGSATGTGTSSADLTFNDSTDVLTLVGRMGIGASPGANDALLVQVATEKYLVNENTNSAFYARLQNKANNHSASLYTFGSTYAASPFFSEAGASSTQLVADSTKMVIGLTASGSLKFATNDVVRMTIDGSGDVGINGTPDSAYKLTVKNTSDTKMAVMSTGSNVLAQLAVTANAGETESANVLAGSNDEAGNLLGIAKASGAFFSGGSAVDNTVIGGTKATSTVIVAAGNAQKMKFRSDGDIVVGTGDAAATALATNATAGFLRLTTSAGTPTGAAVDGSIHIDTTNHKLYFRSGGTWRDAGP